MTIYFITTEIIHEDKRRNGERMNKKELYIKLAKEGDLSLKNPNMVKEIGDKSE